MRLLWHAVLIGSLALAGAYAGGVAGAAWLIPKPAGLAGGAMVLGYMALGALILATVGLIAGFRLGERALRNAALIIGVPVLIGAAVLVGGAVLASRSSREPDAAFAAAGLYRASMERLNSSDPYLFVKMEIDSSARTWTQTGPPPGQQVIYATMVARTLTDIRTALNVVAAMDDAELADCRAAQGPAIKRLQWQITDTQAASGDPKSGQSGVLDASIACLRAHPAVARALTLIEKAPLAPGGKIREK